MKKLYALKTKQLTVALAVIFSVLAGSHQSFAQNSSEKQLLTFSIKNIAGSTGTINQSTYTVAVTVPFSTNLTNLVAEFTSSAGSTVSVSGAPQVSGTTANDFTNPVTYKVTAENGSTRNYLVTVSKAAAVAGKELLTFKFEAFTPDIEGAINQTNHTVSLTVPFSTNLATLVASFTSSTLSTVWVGATQQVSGVTVNNFSAPVTYRVIAENGTHQDYVVTVSKAVASSLKDITQFSFTNLAPVVPGTINQVTQTINVTIPWAADITTLVASFTNSPYSAVTIGGVPQVSGTTPNNFTADKTYRVTAEDGSTKDYVVHVTKTPASTANDILTFNFEVGFDPDIVGVINQTTKAITLTVPWATNVTALVPTFTNSQFSTIWVGGLQQTSGVTAQNFTNPVQYVCRAQDLSDEIYTVTVNKVPASTANSILSFGFHTQFNPDINGTINESAKTIAVTVPFSANLTTLVATFTSSPLSTVWIAATQQVSGTTANNFTNPVQYICRAQDGSEEIYTVTVTKATASTAKALLTFSFAGLTPPVNGVINETAKTVAVTVPFSTNTAAMTATFTQSSLSTVWIGGVQQTSGTTVNNFTAPVTYRVIAEDNSFVDYVVTVTKVAASSAKAILGFSFAALVPPVNGTINESAKTIALTVPSGTNVTNLVAQFTHSPLSTVWIGAVQQTSGTTANNFTNTVTYKVVAEDNSFAEYVVTVTVTAASSLKAITAFSFAGLTPVVNGVINEAAKTISMTVPYGTNVTALVATFTVSQFATVQVGATVQLSGTTPNNFTTPVAYDVTAQNGTTTQYIVTVTIHEMAKQILTYAFTGTFNNGPGAVPYQAVGTINHTTRTIQVNVPNSVNRNGLIAAFTLSTGVTAHIGAIPQVSGTTANDFTAVVTYTLLATDGSTTTYQVTVVNNPVETGESILTFAFNGLTPAVTATINQTNHTIAATVPFGTNVTALVATFTHSALSLVKVGAVLQASGTTANNFTNPVTYTAIAENGATQDYVVTVTVQTASSAKDITYFAFEDLNPDAIGIINETTRTISVEVPATTNRAMLVAYFTASPLTTVRVRNQGIQISGVTINDFTVPLVYEVYAQDNSMKEYIVNVYITADTTPPVVFNLAQTVTNLPGMFALVRSNEATGKVFIIRDGVLQTTVAHLEAAVLAGNGRSAFVTAANTDIPISVENLRGGIYYAYAIDGAGNKSAKGTNAISILDQLAPNVFVQAQTISNAPNKIVNVRSSDPDGFVYLVREGVPQANKAQLDAAFATLNAGRSFVTAANTDIPISIDGLQPGNYRAYAVDMSFNLSAPSTSIVIITQASRLKSILAYSFNQLNPPAVAQIIGTDISVTVPAGTNISNLIASFTVSPVTKVFVGLVEQVSGVTPNNFTQPVVYTVEAEDLSTLDYTVRVFFSTGIEDIEWFNMVRIYPNPFQDVLNIETPVPADKIVVVNSLGQTMETLFDQKTTQVQIPTISWTRGLYLVRFYRDGRLVGTEKVIK